MRKKYKAEVVAAVKPLAPTKCEECEKRFAPKYSEQRYCSRACYTAYLKTHAHGHRLEKLFKPRNVKQHLSDPLDEIDDELWAERAKYWESQAQDQKPISKMYGRGAVRERRPLVLTGHGVRLKVERGALFIRNGFIYYPQKRQEFRLFPGNWRLPSQIILIESSGSISLHVIKWLKQQSVPLVILSWQGEIVSVIGEPQTAADPDLVRVQRAALESEKGLEFSIELIRAKITASQETLKSLPNEYGWSETIHRLELIKKSLKHRATDFTQLRMLEAVAAQMYFAVWQKIPLKWKEDRKRPIPDDWRFFTQRESMIGAQNRHATHPVNAMLNYAYRILETQVKIATVSAGFDPTIGYLHVCRPGRMALVYDLIEPLRPRVDRVVWDFLRLRTFTAQDFILSERGTCRLHPSLAKRLVEMALDLKAIQSVIEFAKTRCEDTLNRATQD
jgi:CRISP-associated protein Cas1